MDMEKEQEKELPDAAMAAFRDLLEQHGAPVALWTSLPAQVVVTKETLPHMDEWRDKSR